MHYTGNAVVDLATAREEFMARMIRVAQAPIYESVVKDEGFDPRLSIL